MSINWLLDQQPTYETVEQARKADKLLTDEKSLERLESKLKKALSKSDVPDDKELQTLLQTHFDQINPRNKLEKFELYLNTDGFTDENIYSD